MPRFAADVMLGRLARWLRVLGCDVAYGSHLHGHTLLRCARDERRILLTRDRRLRREPSPPPHVFITDDRFRVQLAQVVGAVPLPRPAPFTRCLHCNRLLEEISPAEAEDRVPPQVLARQTSVARCPRCRRHFWPGAHRKRMEREVAALGIAHG
jgi:uncharacterized protein